MTRLVEGGQEADAKLAATAGGTNNLATTISRGRGVNGVTMNGVLFAPKNFTKNDLILGCPNNNLVIDLYSAGEVQLNELGAFGILEQIRAIWVPKYKAHVLNDGNAVEQDAKDHFAYVSLLLCGGFKEGQQLWRYNTQKKNISAITAREAVACIASTEFEFQQDE